MSSGSYLSYTPSMQELIRKLTKLPGIGTKSAERIAFAVLKFSSQEIEELTTAIHNTHKNTKFCKNCFSLTEDEICSICSDYSRDASTICVVENYKDVISMEKTLDYKGLYHVLMGHIAPLDGIGPQELKIKELIERVNKGNIKEIILATNPNTEGQATAMYIAEQLREIDQLIITRLAMGIPLGSDLEFIDPLTLSRSLSGREVIK